jgi:hypothetical protein
MEVRGEKEQAIEKLDAVIQSMRPAGASLDSIHKMAVEAGAGLALASPPNNVPGQAERSPVRANGIPDK